MFENKTYIVKQGTSVDTVIKDLNMFSKDNWETSGVLKNNGGDVIFFLKRKIHEKRFKK